MVAAVTEKPASPRTRSSAPQRRRDVVAAVVELARERGPEGITTQAIADRVGVTNGALFRHFPDKLAMWSAVFDWVEERLEAVVDEAFRGGGDPIEVLERVFLAHVRFVSGHPGVPRILFHELQRPADSEFRDRVRNAVRGYRKRIGELLAQANLRIIEATAKHAGMPLDKVMINVDRYGNTSSASIPLALDQGVKEGRITPGMTLLLVSFGGGFTWASAVVKW